MNDQILMDNYILVLKSTVEVYVHGTLESSNEEVRSVLRDGLDKTLTAQANTYDKMTEFGWYTINNVKNTDIKQTLKKLEQNN